VRGDQAQARPRLRFSHVGIFVRDLERMERFYVDVLGFVVTDRGIVRGAPIVFTTWDADEHHQIALVGGRPDLTGFNIINQISFRVGSVEEIQAVWSRVSGADGVSDLRGVNHGNAWSLYFRDPEGSRIEIFADSDWYISQPCIEELDLSLPASEIRTQSENFCRRAPGFQPIAEYRKVIADRIREHNGHRDLGRGETQGG